MIARYTRPELAEIWSDHAHFEAMREVEVAACEEMDGPTEAELEAIRAATFTVEAIAEREKVTDHDTAAFVDVLAASAGPAGRWIHYGLTSSDVLDTGLALQLRRVRRAGAARRSRGSCRRSPRARASTCTRCASGRTHGIHAEPTTFGIKLAGFAFEADRNARRLERAFEQAAGRRALGCCRDLLGHLARVRGAGAARLGLEREPVSTQVVARDRHAELLQAIALAGAGLERFATELRHLARTEVGEVRSRSAPGQKGSSAMPHKRNPIKSEQIAGLARVLRGNAQAALENVALWHERDISHSSVERVILPDSTILLDHMQRRMLAPGRGHGRRRGAHAREPRADPRGPVLPAGAARAGRARDAPATTPTGSSSAWRSRRSTQRTPLRDLLAADPRAARPRSRRDLRLPPFVRYADEIVGRLDQIA